MMDSMESRLKDIRECIRMIAVRICKFNAMKRDPAHFTCPFQSILNVV